MANIGFIGLGHMGQPMAKKLLDNGHEVFVYDICHDAMNKLASFGAIPEPSIKKLATDTEVIFTMLQTGEQVKEVCLEKEGLFNTLLDGSFYIDCSSIDVLTSRELHELAKQKKIAMVDAPVSGGVAAAEKGTLTFMVGGSEANFYQAKKYLSCLGKRVIHAGEAGNGQVAKICNNMILGVSMIAVSEGFVLAKKLGLDPKKFFEIASHASSQCWSMSHYCPMPHVLKNVPSSNDFIPGFAASMMLKDLRLSQDAAEQVNTSTSLAAQATALYSLFVEEEGHANLDFSGIIKMIASDMDF